MARCVRTAGAGFLLAVLWMDLMFDVQILGHAAGAATLEPALASIAAYYRRVTVDSWPMGALVGAVMFVTVCATAWTAFRERDVRSVLSLLLIAAPVGLALVRVFPGAVHLSARSDPSSAQVDLARTICIDHLVCFAAVSTFLFLQLLDARRSAPKVKGG